MPCGVSSMRRQWRDIIAIGKLLNCMVARASLAEHCAALAPPPVTMARVARSGFSTAIFAFVRSALPSNLAATACASRCPVA